MTKYTHPDFDGIFPKPKGVWVDVGGQKIASSFFQTAAPEKIAELGFVEYVEPEQDPNSPSQAEVIAERERRLALGFDHDFDDERGVHRIGTTPADMRKWLDEVTPISQALINAGNPTGEIGIFTDTGPVTVTAAEWQQILLAAGAWRQPIYQASFALQAMDPIPAEYADDGWWE